MLAMPSTRPLASNTRPVTGADSALASHVTMGAIILLVVMIRAMRSHFSENNHFAFEAAAWYWHFVDVVWLGLFIFVYLL